MNGLTWFVETVLSRVYLACVVTLAVVQGFSPPGIWWAYWAKDEAYFNNFNAVTEQIEGWTLVQRKDGCVLRKPAPGNWVQFAAIADGVQITVYSHDRLWRTGRDIPDQKIRLGTVEWTVPAVWKIVENGSAGGALIATVTRKPAEFSDDLGNAETLIMPPFAVSVPGRKVVEKFKVCLENRTPDAAFKHS